MTLYPRLQESIAELDRQVSEQTQQRTDARRLMTHPGVGPVTALATEVFLGDPKRFSDGKALASYIGMIPSEHSSGRRQREFEYIIMVARDRRDVWWTTLSR